MQNSTNRSSVLWCGTLFPSNRTRSIKKLLLVMKLTSLLLIVTFMHVYATGFSQSVTLNAQKMPMKAVFQRIEEQTGYVVFYNKALLSAAEKVTLQAKNQPLANFLDQLFATQPLKYRIEGKSIILSRKNSAALEELPVAPVADPITITGHIGDFTGNPLPGATVRVKGKKEIFAVSDSKGAYSIKCNAGETLVFSYVGYLSREVPVSSSTQLNIMLEREEKSIKDVIITGMITRKKESFTGATASFTGEQLKTVNNQNIIQGLKALDPSFVQIENNLAGSNPNVLPTIELRGQTSISTNTLRDQFSNDPNQPLFILNGFETNLRTIIDLDINLVASVTILKDAASTAIYGSRASNGVIVVETKKPQPGKINLSYTSDWQVEMPDLSSYNMMNADEKLRFEKLSGGYIDKNNLPLGQDMLDSLYNQRLQNVLKGVNTYWLNKPLKTGITQRHSVNVTGGDQAFQYELGANYRANNATMIGSKRNDWGVTMNLFYNTRRVHIGNRAYVNGYNSAESPYGSFSTWASANPYYAIPSDNSHYLEPLGAASIPGYMKSPNPFYNASLASFNKSKGISLQDNLQISVDVTNAFRIQANAQLQKGTDETMVFVSPLNTMYDTQNDPTLKGSYNYGKLDPFSYNANISATYAKILAQRHSLTGFLRAEIAESRNQSNGYSAVGFPNASNGNPAFAYGFAAGSTPISATSVVRRNSVIASFNYSYDRRYNLDLNANLDGSTAFGSNRRYQPYYSAGASWNLHNEAFLKTLTWINNLRLRGNIGLTGNQNFGNVSQSVYKYYTNINSMGQGVYLTALGAPDLQWQSTLQTSVGLDATIFKNTLNIQLNAYQKSTNPLVVPITLPSSSGLSSYPFNAGMSTVKGWEAMITWYPIYQPGKIVWSLGVTGAGLTQQYDRFNDKLSVLNKELQQSNALTRYKDGYSSYDLWAVKSLGIDPATGREVFLNKAGQQTFTYSPDDQVVVGSSRPQAEGIFNSTLNYRGFRAGIYFRYIWHRDQFNTALYNKVENISYDNLMKNQDKRALYDRWKQPGDITSFKGISITETTPISSRFIQTENTFSAESFNLGYEFRNQPWLQRASLAALSLTAYTNDLFYFSTVRRERGIDYPFARSVSFSLRATFK